MLIALPPTVFLTHEHELLLKLVEPVLTDIADNDMTSDLELQCTYVIDHSAIMVSCPRYDKQLNVVLIDSRLDIIPRTKLSRFSKFSHDLSQPLDQQELRLVLLKFLLGPISLENLS